MTIFVKNTLLASVARFFLWWRGLLRSFSFRDKCVVSTLLFVIIGTCIYWGMAWYKQLTDEVPDFGGTYIEGMVGSPLYINPVLAKTGGPHYDLSRLIFSGILEYAPDGSLRNDMAKDWNISEDGKVYTVFLKQNILWHDGRMVTADDVLFTVDIIKNLAFKSPLREAWLNVNVSRGEDNYTILFTLDTPRADFVELLTTGILPKHAWESVTPENFPLHSLNLEPIGNGPYIFERSQKDDSGKILIYEVTSFEEYYQKEPYITSLVFKFYPDRESLIDAYKNKEIKSINGIDSWIWENLGDYKEHLHLYSIENPNYYVVYFNQNKSKALSYQEVRKALSLATDKKQLVEEIFYGKARGVNNPFLDTDEEEDSSWESRVEEANTLLEEKGWFRSEDGVRQKDGVRLEFDMLTTDWKEFTAGGDILTKQWNEIGVRINIKVVSVYDLWNNFIRPREYEILFSAHMTTLIPDMYPFWHSSRTKDPGLNFSVYKNENLDVLIEDLRIQRDEERRGEIIQKIEEIFQNDVPALYLFSADYLYPMDKKVQNISVSRVSEDADRFFDVENWYIKTKRIWK
jgi:peptide/nickel transport system substrate-binding protein